MAHLIIADGKLLVFKIDGELVLVELTKTAYREIDRIQISDGTIRALPALANGQIFVRDTNGKLAAWELP